MFVFIDESGDVGFKFKAGSSKFFVLSLIIFETSDLVDKADFVIQQQKNKDKIKPEYKLSKTKDVFKENFFNCIKELSFKIVSLIVEKEKLQNNELKTKSKKFYNYFLRKVIEQSPLVNASIKIDESSNAELQQQIKSYVKKNNYEKIKKFKFEDSKTNNLIQLADMIAGATNNFYLKRNKESMRYREFFKDKIVLEIVFKG